MKQQLIYVLEPSPVIQDMLLTVINKKARIVFFTHFDPLLDVFSNGPSPETILLPLMIDRNDHSRLLIQICRRNVPFTGLTQLSYFHSPPNPTHVVFPMDNLRRIKRTPLYNLRARFYNCLNTHIASR